MKYAYMVTSHSGNLFINPLSKHGLFTVGPGWKLVCQLLRRLATQLFPGTHHYARKHVTSHSQQHVRDTIQVVVGTALQTIPQQWLRALCVRCGGVGEKVHGMS